jgi:PAS domain S-box-containing protein
MNSSDIIWEVDHKGRIQFISGKVKQILGYTRKELIGKTPYYLMSPPEKKRVKKIFHAHLERRENISDFESVILTKNKEKRVFLTNGVPIFDKEDNLIGYRGVEKDITERKRVEEKFQELFNNMKSGVAVYDVLNNGKKIVFNDFNKAAEEIDHVKLKDIKGKSLLKVFPMSRKLGVYDSIRRVWRTGNSEYFSSNFKLDSGEEVWRDNFIYRLPSGTVVAIYEDVSEKVKVNKKIEENERKFHKIFEASPEAIVILDSESKIVDSNSRVTEWLDYKVDEIRGKSLLEIPFFSDEGKKKVIEKFKEKMKNADKRIAPYEIEFFGKKGEKMIGRIYTRTIRDKNGNPLQDLVMISDVTKNKEEEKKREERQRELEKMNKIMVGRELKMIELKNKIKELKDKLR